MDEARRTGLERETATSLAHPWFTYYLARLDGRPAAVARRATFDGASYLSSIGTVGWARGRGLGGLLTRLASADALAAGSEWTISACSPRTRRRARVYRRAGFERLGQSCPDLVLL